MNFKELLLRAQAEDQQAKEKLLSLYQPLLMKESVINGVFDEDVYQELCITLLICIKRFKV
ncbi:helix-turn-helix domain-containing protein [Pseudoflavonifractor capillosus]|uniref:Helix-turn-helix domain-containing protein n=1 Tax=Pseudoflavonifractor capillosus TaxID=106588 RepID=A0A921MJX7_9FIRM|nr:helix-turn-helix domain-containing protein [Pseudoflavonifractor capillosus]HJG85622.1 helix-turn-helix domain-containing protein [Pseudoflavonifractor capillosus]